MMQQAANIITNSNKIDFEFEFNKCKTKEEIDVSLPTLIIGYDIARNTIKDFSLLKKEYPEQNIWWTFLKTEKRIDYDKDLVKFKDVIINGIVKNIKYILIDVINISKEEKEKIWKELLTDKYKVIYNHYNKFLFIYIKEEAKVYGLPLTTCRFLGNDTDKIIKKLKNRPNNILINDFNNIPVDIRRKMDVNTHYLLVLNEYFC